MHVHKFWDFNSQSKTSEISNKRAFRISGTLVRRTKLRKSQPMHFQKLWDSGSQNKAWELSKNTLSEIRGLWFAEQHVGTLTNELSEYLGLRLAEQNVGNKKERTCASISSGTPIRRTKRRKSQQIHVHKLFDSGSQNNTSEIKTNGERNQKVWDSKSQNKTSRI